MIWSCLIKRMSLPCVESCCLTCSWLWTKPFQPGVTRVFVRNKWPLGSWFVLAHIASFRMRLPPDAVCVLLLVTEGQSACNLGQDIEGPSSKMLFSSPLSVFKEGRLFNPVKPDDSLKNPFFFFQLKFIEYLGKIKKKKKSIFDTSGFHGSYSLIW